MNKNHCFSMQSLRYATYRTGPYLSMRCKAETANGSVPKRRVVGGASNILTKEPDVVVDVANASCDCFRKELPKYVIAFGLNSRPAYEIALQT